MSNIGLGIIAGAWLIQFLCLKKKQNISRAFVAGYISGVILLIWDGFRSGLTSLAWLNTACLLLALGTLGKIKK
jgi:hypothetical protein